MAAIAHPLFHSLVSLSADMQAVLKEVATYGDTADSIIQRAMYGEFKGETWRRLADFTDIVRTHTQHCLAAHNCGLCTTTAHGSASCLLLLVLLLTSLAAGSAVPIRTRRL